MSYQSLDLGSVANDGTGDTLRASGDKINDNFSEIYTLLGDGTSLSSGISATATVVTLTAPTISGVVSGTITSATITTLASTTVNATTLNGGTLALAAGSITDSSGAISFGNENLTTTGSVTAASLDISGNVDIDGTLETDALTIDGVTLAETIADTVGAMVASNTETNITVTYDDSDNTLDFVVGTLNQSTSGNAATATALETARTIHGVSFDGTANIDLSEVVQDTVGAMFSSNTETNITATYQDSDGTIDLVIGTLNQDTTGNAATATALETARTIHGVSFDGTANIDLTEVVQDTVGAMFSSNTETGITATYQDADGTIDLVIGTLNQNTTGNAATATALETARTIHGVSFDGTGNIDLTEVVQDTVGAMFGSNTETGITVTYQDADGTIDLVVGTLNQDTTGTAAKVTVTDSTANTNFPVTFHDESNSLLDDTGALRYNPSTGTLLVPNLVVAGTTTQVDTVTMNAENAVIFEGATADDHETTLTIIDPTADRTQRLLNQSGYIPLLAAVTTTAITSTPEELNILDGATVVVGEINALDLGSTAVGTAIASKAVILDSNKDYTGIRNFTVSGELDAATGDFSGNVDVDGTLEADAITVNGTALDEFISDTVGAMVSSNTETGIAVTYQDADNTIDFALNAAQTTITSLLATDIKIGEDDQTKIDFETADTINFYAGNEKQLILTDGALTPGADNILDLGSSSVEFKDAYFDGTVTSDAFAGPLTGNVTGNADTATALATARTIGGVSFDGSANINLPGVNTAGNQNTSGTAAVATTVTITDNESTDENNAIVFTAGGDVDGGNLGLESDGTLTYNPSTGKITATGFVGALTGDVTGDVTGNVSGTAATVTGAAQTNITSLGTLTTLTVDNIIINGTNIGHTSDTDAIAIASNGVVTFSQAPVFPDGSIAVADLDIDGATDIGADLADADLFIVDDGAGGTNRKSTLSRLKSYMSAGSTTAADDITAGDAAVTITTSSGNITIDAAADDSDIILKGTDGGVDTTFLTIDGSAAGEATFNAGIVIADAGNIGSASDKDAIAIASDGVVTMNQIPVFSAGINVSGGSIAGTLSTAAQGNITSLGTLTTLTVDNVVINGATIGHGDDTDLMTVADGILTVAGEVSMTTLDIGGTNVTSTAAELNVLDGITAVVGELNALDLGSTAVGTAIASKAVILDSNKDYTGLRNFTVTGDIGVGDDINLTSDSALVTFGANSEITLTHVHDVGLTVTNTINGTDNRPVVLQLKSEEDEIVQDDVIASIEMAAGDSDGTDGATVAAGIHAIAEGTFSASANATKLVFTTGVSETAASSATAKMTLSSAGLLTIADDFVIKDGGTIGVASDTDSITIASDGVVTFSQEIVAPSLDISGNVDIDGTLEADAITVNGATLAETISDTVGAMVGSNTETGITVTYQDADNTLDFALGAAQTTITSLLATDIKIGEDDQTKIDFETADEIHFYAANAHQIKLVDGALVPATDNDVDLGTSSAEFKDAYFDGTVTADAFAGPLTGNVTGNVSGTAATVTGAAQTNITSLGTLTALTVDNVVINGATIGHGDDTDLMTVADGILTVAGEVSMTTLDIGGTNVTSTAAELNILDGATVVVGEINALDLGSTAVGNAIASKAVILDSNKDYTGIRNFTIDGDLDVGDDLKLTSDAALISFGANSEITMTHVHDTGLTLTHTATGDNTPMVLQLKSEEDIVEANEVIASIEFAAGDSDGTDGATVAAGIHAIAEGTFSASANATKLVFTTGVSETAASSATAKMTLSSAGLLTIADDLVIKDGGTIGVASDADAITIASNGQVTLTQTLIGTALDISGDVDVDGTLEADAITVNGTALAEFISDTAGAMVSSNTETGIAVTYQDADNTIDFAINAAQTTITSLLATDIKIGEDDQTKIDFETADEIHFYAANAHQVKIVDGAIVPATDDDVDLGTSSAEFKNAFFDGTVTSDAFAGPLTGNVTGNADTATALATARTIGGVSFDGTGNINLPGVNTAGNQDTSGTAALATLATVTDSTANTNFPVVFHDESNALLDDTGALRYNPSSGTLLVPNLVVAGTTTQVDTVTMNAQNAVVFEGATADDHETTLTIIDPTGDRTINLPNVSGTIPVLAAASTTQVTSTPEELNILDGATVVVGEINALDLGSTAVGTAIASKAVILDSNKDYTGVRNFTLSGELDAGSLDVSGDVDIDGTLEADAITVNGTALAEFISDTAGAMVSSNTETGITVTYQDADNTIDFAINAAQTTITSLLATDIKIGEDDQTKIDFETADEIHFYAANAHQIKLVDGALVPATDNDVDLGTSLVEFKNAFFDGTVTSDAFAGPLTGNVTGNADTATALATARTIGGVSFNGTANINLPGVNTAGNQNTSGSAATLTTARSIAMSGDVVWSVSFNGSGNVTAAGTIQSGAVETGMIAADAITGAKIADNAINSEHYTDGSIDTAHIANDQITQAKMANDSVGSAELKTLSTLLIKNSSGTTLKTCHTAGA